MTPHTVRLGSWLLPLLFASWAAQAEERGPGAALKLVGADAALICEIERPKAQWESLQQGELFQRLQRSRLYQEFWQTDKARAWQKFDQSIAEKTGAKLSDLLLDLCAQDLVLAVYLPENQQPEGILLARAESPQSIQRALAAWQKLVPDSVVETATHRGQKYQVRRHAGAKRQHLYFAVLGEVFALTDHESRLQQVIELSQLGAGSAKQPIRFVDGRLFAQTRRPEEPAAAVRLTLIAAPWEPVWRDAAKDDAGAAMLLRNWRQIQLLVLTLNASAGLHAEFNLHLDPEQTSAEWKAWSASTPNPAEFLAKVPDEAFLAAAGGIHFTPLWEALQQLMPAEDREGFQKGRRIARGFLGGHDPLTEVFPALLHDVGVYLVPAPHQPGLPFDGVVASRFPPGEGVRGLHWALDQAFSSGLSLLSVQINEKYPQDDPATVKSELKEDSLLRWLETGLPVAVAYRLTPDGGIASRTIQTLRTHLQPPAAAAPPSSFVAWREEFFPESAQFLCWNLRRWRDSGPQVDEPKSQESPAPADIRLSQARRELSQLADVLYVGARSHARGLTIRLGIAPQAAPKK